MDGPVFKFVLLCAYVCVRVWCIVHMSSHDQYTHGSRLTTGYLLKIRQLLGCSWMYLVRYVVL